MVTLIGIKIVRIRLTGPVGTSPINDAYYEVMFEKTVGYTHAYTTRLLKYADFIRMQWQNVVDDAHEELKHMLKVR